MHGCIDAWIHGCIDAWPMRWGSGVYCPVALLCGRGPGQRSRCKCKRNYVNLKESLVHKENFRFN